VRVTPNGRYVISSSKDGTLRIWDLEAALEDRAVPARVLRGHTGSVWDVAVSAESERIASVGDDGHLLLWEIHGNDDPAARHRVTGAALRSVAFLRGRDQVLVGDIRGRLTRLTLDGGDPLAQQKEHDSSIFAIVVTNDVSRALTASYDRTVKVWSLEGRSLAAAQTLSGHSGRVYDVVLSPKDQEAISTADDGMLKVWQLTARLTTPKGQRQPKGHQGTVRSLALAPDAASPMLALSSAHDGTLKVWDVDHGRSLHSSRPMDNPLDPSTAARHYEAVALLDRDTVAAAALDRALILRRLADGAAVRNLRRRAEAGEPPSNEVRDLAVSPDRRRVVSAAGDGHLTLWDLESGEALRTSEGHADVARVVTFGPDGDRLLSGGDDGALKIWNAQTGVLRATLPSPDAGPVRGIALLPHQQVVVGYEEGLLVIWDLSQRRDVRRMWTQGLGLRGLVVTEGGQRVIVADNRRTLRVWDTASLRQDGAAPLEPVALVRLESGLRSMALSPGTGTLLAGDCVGGVSCLQYVEADT
jgi:WD40 repeat protein